MPKGTKAAPPQQASLNELWKGKGKGTTPKDASSSPENASKLEQTEVRHKSPSRTNGEGTSRASWSSKAEIDMILEKRSVSPKAEDMDVSSMLYSSKT